MGISLGQREGEHIKITMLTDRLPFRLAQIVNIISDIVVIIICAVIFYYGVRLVVAQGNVPYAGIKISTSWGYLAMVLGGLMILHTLVSIKRSALTLINGELPIRLQGPEGD
ncbi:MAG: TRAP transporter small permease [Flavonifractor plautii]